HVAHAADRLGARLLTRHVVTGDARLRLGFTPGAALRTADDVDVDRYRQAFVYRCGPERVIVARQFAVARRPVRDDHTLRAARFRLAQRVDGHIDTERWDLREPDEPARVGGTELFEQKVVVRLDAGEHEVFVVVTEEVAHRALRREQQ